MNDEVMNEGKELMNALSGANRDIASHVDSKLQKARIYNPIAEVEESLVTFIKNRLEKIKADNEFEETLKEELMARFAEADFGDLVNLLNRIQVNTNSATEKILALFTSQERSLLETPAANPTSSKEEEIFNAIDSHEILQSLAGLSALLKPPQAKTKNVTESKEETATN